MTPLPVSDAEFRQALSLAAHDALANTPEPTPDALGALRLLMSRLAQSERFTVEEEGEWLTHLQDFGWELVAPFDPESFRRLIRP